MKKKTASVARAVEKAQIAARRETDAARVHEKARRARERAEEELKDLVRADTSAEAGKEVPNPQP